MGIQKDLGKVAGLLESHCHLTMKNKLKSDKEYQAMKLSDAAELYRIIKWISTGHESVQHPARSGIESLYDMMFLRGQDCESLMAYYEQFEHRAENAERMGMWLGSELLRDLIIQDDISGNDRRNTNVHRRNRGSNFRRTRINGSRQQRVLPYDLCFLPEQNTGRHNRLCRPCIQSITFETR